jgi:hypothetical protein
MQSEVRERFRSTTEYISRISDDRSYQRTLAHSLAEPRSIVTAVKRRIEAVELYELTQIPRTVY